MSVVDMLLTNTVLIPASDSLVESNPVKPVELADGVAVFNKRLEKEETVQSTQFKVYFISTEKTESSTCEHSVLAGICEDIKGLRVTRAAEETRTGGNGDYTVKLPGKIAYNAVTLSHFYCDGDLFMNWLINGAGHGGVQRANIEIHVGPHMVYTLRDAFPIQWNMGTMSINAEGLVTNRETITYSIDGERILVENVTLVYSRLDYVFVPKLLG